MSERDPLSPSPEVTPADAFHRAMQAVERHNQRYITFIADQRPAVSGTTLSVEDELAFMHVAHGSVLREVGVDLIERHTVPVLGATTLRATLIDSERFSLFLCNVPFRPYLPEMHDSVADIVNEALSQLEYLNDTESPLLHAAARQIISLEPGLSQIGMQSSRQLAEVRALKNAEETAILPEYLSARSLNILPVFNNSEVAPSAWHEESNAHYLHMQWNQITHFLRTLTGKAHTQSFLKELLGVTKQYLQQSEAAWEAKERFRRDTDEAAYTSVFEAIWNDIYEIELSISR